MQSKAMQSSGLPWRIPASAASLSAAGDSSLTTAAGAGVGSDAVSDATASWGGNRLTPRFASSARSMNPGKPSPADFFFFFFFPHPPSAGSASASSLNMTGALSLKFALSSREYLSRSGQVSVRPLKLGRNILILGPGSDGAAWGSASEHSSAPLPSLTTTLSPPFVSLGASSFLRSAFFHPPFTNLSARASPDSGLVSFHQPCLSGARSSSSLKSTKCEGSPHVLTPCCLASLLLTRTLAAHAHDVGGFHTRPPRATISSKVPAGESSYLAK
mmetsp:Transcript_14369/g.56732  ORF Transcript_14369/g.56732 Transcript_14369/m.56732 type:complete len:273 (-) Transcript_14369:177-995(-)